MNSPRWVFYRIFFGFLQRLSLLECYSVTFFVFRFFRFFSQKISLKIENAVFSDFWRGSQRKISHKKYFFSEKKTKKSKNKKRHVIAFHVTEPLQKTKKDSIKNGARTIHLKKIRFCVALDKIA